MLLGAPGPVERHRCTAASADAVWAVLADGWSYAAWVVGASRVRAVAAGWPAEGTEIDHSVGTWPLMIDDTTTVQRCEPGRLLVLKGRAWPFGSAGIEFGLVPSADGCTVVMREDVAEGPARVLPHPLVTALLVPRNDETLRRLCLLAERRTARE